jgi:ubiquitin-like modifier-activating enzyme ATG7
MPSIIKFDAPSVRVDNSVWMWLAKEKLDRLKLSTEPILNQQTIHTESKGSSSQLVVSGENTEASSFGSVLINVNTAKEFREMDRKRVFDGYSKILLDNPHVSKLFLISFADLKTYTFTYNVAVPAVGPEGYDFEFEDLKSLPASSPTIFAETSETVIRLLQASDQTEIPFTPSAIRHGDTIVINDKSFANEDSSVLPFYVRTVLTSIAATLGPNSELTVNISLFTEQSSVGLRHVTIKPSPSVRLIPNWVKWLNPVSQQPTAIMSVDLKRFMDPVTIASESVALNIKLMKWRLLPSLAPEKMSDLKFLLIGAGTLGCSVARCLLAWGVTNITFVDSGRVSFSNPARQWLFTLEDAASGAPKAETAAKRLKEVLPSETISGIDLSVPLPGHPGDLSHLDSSFSHLETLIKSNDVVFMLTDSRESRWLPSLLANAYNKLGVSVALGFDSYLVKIQTFKTQSSSCYFCNDVNAPTDQTMFRTLDQQCTVTRPGIAAIASCMAVELVATFTQAKHGFETERTIADNSLLGGLPDQIRGFVGSYQSFPAVTEKFDNCICCSARVVSEFENRGIEFVRDVVRDSDVLMRVSGLTEFNAKVGGGDVIVFDDDLGDL